LRLSIFQLRRLGRYRSSVLVKTCFNMAPSLPQFSAARIRSYIFRLPLFTRAIIFVIIALWVVGMQSIWDVQQWGALIPKEIGLSTSQFHSYCGHLQRGLSNSSWLISSLCSVSYQHISPRACRFLSHIYEYYCFNSVVGKIRGGIRNSNHLGSFSWS
jgi:hypothetical protein